MRIKVNPLIVAAALGLLGPAALADDEDVEATGIAGVWQRDGNAPATASRPSSALHLGQRIEVIPFEDQVLLDDGLKHGLSGGVDGCGVDGRQTQGQWSTNDQGGHQQQLVVDGQDVTRSFQADGDQLAVRTIVLGEHGAQTWLDTFTRQG